MIEDVRDAAAAAGSFACFYCAQHLILKGGVTFCRTKRAVLANRQILFIFPHTGLHFDPRLRLTRVCLREWKINKIWPSRASVED